ncbi:SDR family oxidoreductase [Sporichthya sp.]|uniref:SDR family NAD(P)-dependent oxidoreductase n=1 Tax=Sporichthya sp. TaxID=65475 RepID=UPI00178D1854|nr:SDR family oxidoreductase [Sporichthya sp.]MBA3743918.1 SDR family oxidoreductase [Sporichthya sp.]
MSELHTPRAVVTGGTRGLGLALTRELTARGWHVVINGRDAAVLAAAVAGLPRPERVTAIAGDVADPIHRSALVEAAGPRLDLLVNNASVLGAVPMPGLADYPLTDLEHAFAVNTVAPLRLVQLLLPALRRSGGRVVNLSSDAAVSAYPTWGGYGASKAALDLITAVLAEEHPEVRFYALDPGDMATELAAAAGEDPAGRPAPETVVPAVLRLAEADLPSGRYTAAALTPIRAGR